MEALGFFGALGLLWSAILYYFIQGNHALAQFGKD